MRVQVKLENKNDTVLKIVERFINKPCCGFEMEVLHGTVTIRFYADREDLDFLELYFIPYLDMTYAEDA